MQDGPLARLGSPALPLSAAWAAWAGRDPSLRRVTPSSMPCRILEIISPGGLEEFFAELGSGAAPPDAGARDGLEFDLESIPRLCEEHGLTVAMPGD